jgi:hypothetical protein
MGRKRVQKKRRHKHNRVTFSHFLFLRTDRQTTSSRPTFFLIAPLIQSAANLKTAAPDRSDDTL